MFEKRHNFTASVNIFYSTRGIWILFLSLASCSIFKPATWLPPASQAPAEYFIGFYNVENLFDTLDNPQKLDEDFTPDGKLKWNTERYHRKLNNISRVVEAMGFPVILGLAEVENARVLEDLVKTDLLTPNRYNIVHFDSPDERGIDNALLFRKDFFQLEKTDFIRIEFPDSIASDDASRDIVVANGQFGNGTSVWIFVNHWPSRRGGKSESEPKRFFVASRLRQYMDSLLVMDSKANFLIMGDFNDEPLDPSVEKVLGASPIISPFSDQQLYNCFYEYKMQNKGTYQYRDQANLLDQILLNGSLVSGKAGVKYLSSTIVREDWMLYMDPKHGAVPSKTYGGPNYYGGFSDHLPVVIKVQIIGPGN